MIKYAINIEPLFPGKSLTEKIVLAKQAGFKAVEFWGWKNRDIEKIRETCLKEEITVSAFSGQEDYSICDRENRDNYIDWVLKSIETAKYLDCDKLIIFSNHFTSNGSSDFRDRYSLKAQLANMVNTLTLLAPIVEENNITLLLEPLHNHDADEGMLLTHTQDGADIIRAINSPNIQLLCDLFHMQLMHGNLLSNLMANLDITPYIHIADAPDRHEPGTGEINYPFLMDEINKSSFTGTICLEFFPSGDSMEALANSEKCIYFRD